ncbi:hypothetical protein POZ29_21675, partial [Bacteroides uniformis]|nr:hypothetical protein [Bacteroides uniformis]
PIRLQGIELFNGIYESDADLIANAVKDNDNLGRIELYRVLATTVLIHDPSWDRAIDEVCHTVNDEGDDRVQHFLYSRNAAATPGHPRVAEQQAMADELTAYLESFGPDLWK